MSVSLGRFDLEIVFLFPGGLACPCYQTGFAAVTALLF